jgi:GT2 family glycosyltransferase/peptidoglycan/xylan/chitin deacetylase (PgdA/CDA1 family)
VVTTWKRPNPLQSTLESLLLQSYPCLDIVVVSDGQDPATRAVQDRFLSTKQIRWLYHQENLGLPAARNTGARESRGEIVLFLDDDVIAHPELVATHMAHHLSASPYRRFAVIALAEETRETPLNSFIELGLHRAWQRTLDSFQNTLSVKGTDSIDDPVQECLYFGLNCSIRRDLFLDLQGFNEFFRASDEEMELGARMFAAGIEFEFEPRILLTHRNASNLRTYFLKSWRASGFLDAHRVFVLGQKCAQTRSLAAAFKGPWLKRLPARMAWQFNPALLRLSSQLEAATNKSESNLLFSMWARITQNAEYFRGVREAGCAPDRVRAAVGPERIALMLHSISEPLSPVESRYYISPKRFQRFMHRFLAKGYRSATLKHWLEHEVPAKHVLLTFDDAYDDLFENLLPLVIEHHLRPVVYLVADRIGGSNLWDQANGLRTRNLLTLSQIREMQKYGVEFGSHSLTHPWLPDVSDEQLNRETRDSRHQLEDLLGTEILSFAYPYGGIDQRVRSAVVAAGYKAAFTTLPGANWWNDPFSQRRADINENTSALNFSLSLHNGQGLALSVSSALRSLEQNLPTRPLRALARRLRMSGRSIYRQVSQEARSRNGD